MANKDLKLKPHHIHGDPDAWWYEEPNGICVVVEGAGQHHIRWDYLKAALARKEKGDRGNL